MGNTARGDAAHRDSTALCRPSNGPAPIETGTTEIFHAAVRQHCGLALGDYVYQKTVMSDLST